MVINVLLGDIYHKQYYCFGCSERDDFNQLFSRKKGALKEYYEQTIINNHINHLVFK
jgi:adenine-specific DNA methylase